MARWLPSWHPWRIGMIGLQSHQIAPHPAAGRVYMTPYSCSGVRSLANGGLRLTTTARLSAHVGAIAACRSATALSASIFRRTNHQLSVMISAACISPRLVLTWYSSCSKDAQ